MLDFTRFLPSQNCRDLGEEEKLDSRQPPPPPSPSKSTQAEGSLLCVLVQSPVPRLKLDSRWRAATAFHDGSTSLFSVSPFISTRSILNGPKFGPGSPLRRHQPLSTASPRQWHRLLPRPRPSKVIPVALHY